MLHNQTLWWQQGIIYQVYLRSFKDNNGDGIGDLKGIITQLEYLTWLGIDAIWISPMYPSPMADFGYDIANFTDIDPIFGDLTIFDDLVKQCHQHDLKVIIDFVPNHTSDEHPWFLDSRSSRNSSRRDWYIWADARADGSPPNNWLSVFGGSAWEWDAPTGQFYLHSFHKKQPDLNWRNEALKTAMFGVVHFWMERGVDGLRVDAGEFIMKDAQLRDNPLNPGQKWTYQKSLGAYDSQIHLYDKGDPDIHIVYRELRSLLDSYNTQSPRMAIGEIRIFDWKEWASYYGANLDELHTLYNFGLMGAKWKAQAIHQFVDGVEASLLPGAWPGYALSDHDDPRVASRLGQVQARAAMLLLLTLPCIPTIYYGDEIGMHDVLIPLEGIKDPWEKSTPGIGLGRDPQRTPMQWDSSPNAGFCPPTTTPWLPIADDYKHINVAAEDEDPHSMLALTRALIQIRQATPALKIGSFQPIAGVPDDCYAYLRRFERQRYIISLNFSGDEQIVRLPELGSGHIAISTFLDREETINLAAFYLRGHEGCIIELHE